MTEKQYFGPLTLHQKCENTSILKCKEVQECLCVLCETNFTLPEDEKQLLTHLFMEHRLVIADVNQVADLKSYLLYWRLRFKDENIPFFCTTMLLDGKPDGTKSKDEEYYLLSDVLPEDKELRLNLNQTRLDKIMKQHQFEREDKNYERECLFCRFTSNDSRGAYLMHLYEKHNFHIAKPDNLIFVDELIDTIASKLERLQCIFCEKYFKDRNVLKEHMRKKGHKRINPDNKEYDKFFVVNYNGEKKVEYKNRVQNKSNYMKKQSAGNSYLRSERYEKDSNADSDPEWSKWTEDDGPLITCLFCKHGEQEFQNILNHMEEKHNFSFQNITNNIDFYHKIKIVNYIRHQIHLKQCLNCDVKFDSLENLDKHMHDANHLSLNKEKWDQPEYYFSTYEDDLFLCFIQDEDESWWPDDEKEVEKRNSMSDSISKEMALAVLNDNE